MRRIKLLKSLMVSGSRLLAPGTILEHSRAEQLIAKGVAVEVPLTEPDVTDDPLVDQNTPEAEEEAEEVPVTEQEEDLMNLSDEPEAVETPEAVEQPPQGKPKGKDKKKAG